MIVDAAPATPEALRRLDCTLRALHDGDVDWQRALFAQSRPELALIRLPGPALEALIAQQFAMQRTHYRSHYAGADHLAIEHAVDGPIGRLIVDRDGERREHCIVDICLHSAWQRRGLGTALLRMCQDDARAQGATLILHVAHHNTHARRLYESLGFVLAEDTGSHVRMHWTPRVS